MRTTLLCWGDLSLCDGSGLREVMVMVMVMGKWTRDEFEGTTHCVE